MNTSKYIVTFLILLFAGSLAMGQSGLKKRADKKFEAMEYASSAKLYEKYLSKEDDLRSKVRLADSYRQLGDIGLAEFWYSRAVQNTSVDKEALFHYGRMLMGGEKYDEAREWFRKYKERGGDQAKALKFMESCDLAKELISKPGQYKITPLPVSTEWSEFGAVQYGQGFIMASARRRGFFCRVINPRNNGHFYDLYGAELNVGGKDPYKVKTLRGKVNSRFHEGPAVVHAKTGTMYFTRSNYDSGKKGESQEGLNKLKIYSAQRVGKKWKNIEELSFNSNEYSCGHPTINKTGDVMIFSSDIPGGFGGTDLYLTKKEGDKWSTPRNLGSEVNTEGDEVFPTLHEGGMLFFSSTGHKGLGGLDIFSAKANGDLFGNVRNAGYPLNSSMDDFSTAWVKNKAKGYFTSNRKGGKGQDDIYMFSRKLAMKGKIVDSRSEKPLPGVSVSVMDVNGKRVNYTTDEDGMFEHFADYGSEYFLTMETKDYFPKKEKVSTKKGSPLEDVEFTIELEREIMFTVFGKVTDAETGEPLPGAAIRINGQAPEIRTASEQDGKFFSNLDENQQYELIVTKPGYRAGLVSFATLGKTGPQDFEYNVQLEKGPYLLVEGKVVDQVNQKSLDNASVRAIAANKREEVTTKTTRSDGKFWMSLDPRLDQYLVIGSRAYYFSSRVELPPVDSLEDESVVPVKIEMIRYRVGEIAKIIYYDYNKSNITLQASKELWEMVYFLLDNPEAKVELGAHTDSRGSAGFNKNLSQNRAEQAVDFIVKRGVDKSRIEAKGYGESKLVNNCKDGVKCTDKQHSLNRRSEMIITGITPIDAETAPEK